MRLLPVAAVLVAIATIAATAAQNPFLGRWNMTGTGDDAGQVFWLELKDEGGTLTGLFLDRTGSPLPLAFARVESGELVFQAQRGAQPGGPVYRARLENGRLVGRHEVTVGGRGRAAGDTPPATREVRWTGVRPPAWPEANANGAHTYGTPVVLFDGTSLDAWGVQHQNRPMNWTIEDGLLANAERANNLVSKQAFSDFRVEAEYRLSERGNSGLYLRGRYELQLLDDYNDTATRPINGHMSIYGRTPPRVNASRPAGEWQRMEAVLVVNRVTVTLNGQRVHDNAVIDGITGGALDNDEAAPGPVMIQGDHSRVWIRRLVVTPITARGR